MEPGFGDFLGQIPAYFFVVPLILGVIYLGVMVYIFRRAAERRRKKREAQEQQLMQMGMMPQPAKAKNVFMPAASPAFTPLPNVPEPDLNDLLSGSLLDEAERMGTSATLTNPLDIPEPTAAAVLTTRKPTEAAMPITPLSPLSASDEVPADAIEVMRIWRDVNDGGLIIQMGNQRYRSAADIQSPDLLRRFTAVVRELGAMIGNAVAPSGNIRPLPPASPAPYALPPRPTSSFSAVSSEPPKSGGVLNRLMGRSAPPPAVPDQPAGIAASVEEFLQARLLGSPEFAQRSIHVRPSLDHGIKIEVDSRYYDSIDEVDDAAVREYLFGMMREWENRQ